jgi:phosphate-selective porin OprO/OprP
MTLANNTASSASSATASDKESTAAVRFGADGLVFSNEDGSNQLRVHGFIQGDGRFFSSDLNDSSPDRLLWRRIRPNFEGTVFKVLDFRFMPDFGQNNALIQDIYLELNVLPFAKPRLGKYKAPLSLEILKADSEFTFLERSLASDLVPNREVGAQIGGSLLSKSITYAVGYFNGTPDGSNGQTFEWRTSNEAVGRIFFQPFATSKLELLKGLGIGIGGSAANEHGTLPSFKTVGQNSFFKYSSKVVADGQHNRVSPQAYYYAGPIGIFTEYNISSQEVAGKATRARLHHQAWQVTGSLMLTGEKNSYSGLRPKYAFEPTRGLRHLGGWELVTRYSRLRVDRDAFPLFADPKKSAAGAAEWGVGINWYLNRFARVGTDYEHTRFDMVSSKVAPLHSENVVMSRIQLAF